MKRYLILTSMELEANDHHEALAEVEGALKGTGIRRWHFCAYREIRP